MSLTTCPGLTVSSITAVAASASCVVDRDRHSGDIGPRPGTGWRRRSPRLQCGDFLLHALYVLFALLDVLDRRMCFCYPHIFPQGHVRRHLNRQWIQRGEDGDGARDQRCQQESNETMLGTSSRDLVAVV